MVYACGCLVSCTENDLSSSGSARAYLCCGERCSLMNMLTAAKARMSSSSITSEQLPDKICAGAGADQREGKRHARLQKKVHDKLSRGKATACCLNGAQKMQTWHARHLASLERSRLTSVPPCMGSASPTASDGPMQSCQTPKLQRNGAFREPSLQDAAAHARPGDASSSAWL